MHPSCAGILSLHFVIAIHMASLGIFTNIYEPVSEGDRTNSRTAASLCCHGFVRTLNLTLTITQTQKTISASVLKHSTTTTTI